MWSYLLPIGKNHNNKNLELILQYHQINGQGDPGVMCSKHSLHLPQHQLHGGCVMKGWLTTPCIGNGVQSFCW